MSHGLPAIEEPLRALPEAVVIAFGLITHLGDTWLVLVLAASLYLFGNRVPVGDLDRRDGAALLGVTLAALAAVVGLKAMIGHPRPPGTHVPPEFSLLPAQLRAQLAPVTAADGYALPSGHALQATAVYGGLAAVGAAGWRRRRIAAAAGIVGLVALSRVVIGVHYLLDVVAGVGAGLVLLALWQVLAADRPGRTLTIAVVVATAAVLTAGFGLPTLALLGLAIGARMTWGVLGPSVPPQPDGTRATRRLLVAGGAVLVALVVLSAAMELDPHTPGVVAVGFLAAGVTAATLVAVPLAVEE